MDFSDRGYFWSYKNYKRWPLDQNNVVTTFIKMASQKFQWLKINLDLPLFYTSKVTHVRFSEQWYLGVASETSALLKVPWRLLPDFYQKTWDGSRG